MKETYRRLRGKADRVNFGTETIQTSGNLNLTGDAILTEDYDIHTYQVIPIGAGPWDGNFKIEVSNDNVNYTCIANYGIQSSEEGVAYSDNWAFAYARPVITGAAGEFLINERHLGTSK
mgnify:FL=1|tara:strand:+ start:5544 stop:5900 length:357 start_codon:yes stop_codon:yes gene_type:complete